MYKERHCGQQDSVEVESGMTLQPFKLTWEMLEEQREQEG